MKYFAGLLVVAVLGIILLAGSALFHNSGNFVLLAKVVCMWLGLALLLHFLTIRAYKLAWLASGNQNSFYVKWHDTIFEVVLALVTLALWLDHYNVL